MLSDETIANFHLPEIRSAVEPSSSPAQDSPKPASNSRSALQSAEAFQQLASDLLQHGQVKMALDYCRLSVQAQPTAKGYKLWGDGLQQLGQFSEAEKLYKKALQLEPVAEVYANLGSLYAQQRQWLKSLSCYRRTIALNPNLAEIQRNIERIWSCIRNSDVEIDAVYNAFVAEPQQATALDHLHLAQVLREHGRIKQAVICYRQALKLDPNLVEAQQQLEKIVKSNAKSNANVTKNAVKHETQPPVVLKSATEFCRLGDTYRQQQQWHKAVSCYERAVALDSDLAQAHWGLARVLERLGKLDAATDRYFRALSLQPTLASAVELCRFGQLFLQQEQLEQALACYRWAVQQDSNCAEAHFQMGEALYRQEHYEAAITSYRQAVKLQPSGQGYHHLADALLKMQQWEAAVAAYTQAVQLDPDFSWSYNNMGDALMHLEQWDAAANAYKRAIQLNPEFVWSHYNLGDVLAKQNQWEKAIVAYQTALQLQPDLTEAAERLHYALHHRAKADLEAALNYYRQAIKQDPTNLALFHRAIEIQPDNANLYLSLVQALVQQEQWDQATVFYDMALQIAPELAKTAPTLRQYLANQQQFQPLQQDFSELLDSQTAAQIIAQSKLFNETYYLAQFPNQSLNLAPLQHYVQIGAKQGYNPHPCFNTAYYLEQYPDVAKAGVNPLAHYLQWGAAEGRNPHPLFQTAFYLEQHPDIAASGMNPLVHYGLYGLAEGRLALSAERVASVIQSTVHDATAAYLHCLRNQTAPARLCAKVGVYCSSLGNYFMAEIADFIAAAFEQVGLTVQRLCETDERPADLDFDVIVAPHEFFYLGTGVNWSDQPWLSRSIMVNVEQPHTSWFAKALRFLYQARIVFDINVTSAAILEQLGIPAYFLPLGYLPNYTPFGKTELPDLFALKGLPRSVREVTPDLDAPLATRPIDLHFIGTLNSRREQFFAKSAAWLSRFHCFFHIPPIEGPLLKGKDQALDTQAVIGLSQRSKILLNIHRGELPYFEWHRIVFHGLWQKTLVVTEPCHEVPGLIPGEHFVECKLNEMEDMVNWLLNTPTGQAEAERIRQAGYRVLTEELATQRVMRAALDLLASVAGGARWN